ncbi:MAG: metallophosphoesterase [Nanoarchaeota archaeon]|nr:metallophosphoesterase [Nanoarchaeota archaeon]
MENDILKLGFEKGLLIDKDAFEILNKIDDIEVVRKIIEIMSKEKILTKMSFANKLHTLEQIKDKDGKKITEKISINLGVKIEIKREVEETNVEEEEIVKNMKVKILSSIKTPPNKLEVKDFVNYFRNRYNFIKGILTQRPELENLTSIGKIVGERQGISIVGIVYDKRITKNKNLILEIEDMTGKINVLINQNKPELMEKAKEIMLDDTIAIKGVGSREIMFVNDFYWPDSFIEEKKHLTQDENVVFTSDLHIGSNMFLENNFLKFIHWINGEMGNEEQKAEALKVKYMFVVGDSIDGVGIFPGQEDVLNIKDIKKQYDKLAELFKKIRKDVTIVICPGQHDAVRVAQPQPPPNKEYAEKLYELDNLIFVGNPCLVEIPNEGDGNGGLKILMFHGASFHGIVDEIEELRQTKARETPTKIVKQLLKRRHLAPSHSADTTPGEEDYLIIRDVPDIITTGELHRPEIDEYNKILMIASSCWQSQTPFEEKVGNNPDPCKVPMFNLKSRKIKILDFSGQEDDTNSNFSKEKMEKRNGEVGK